MLDYVKSDPAAMPFMRDIFVENMDWPGARQIAARLKKSIDPRVLGPDELGELPQVQPPPPDPQVVAQQQKMQLDQQSARAKLQLEQQKATHEMQLEEKRLALEERKLQLDATAAAQKLELERQTALAKMQLEQQSAAAKLQLDQEDRAQKRAGEQEARQFSAHLAAQNGAMLNLGQAVAMAAENVAAPRVTELERDNRGNPVRSRSRRADDE